MRRAIRKEAASVRCDVGAGHLYADDGLRALGSEMIRRRMDDTGVYGSASESDKDKTDDAQFVVARKKQDDPK